jgi:hypothetical protein
MYSIVKVLRTRGQRKHDRDISSATPLEGDLTLFYCAGSPELKLAARGDSTGTPVVPLLIDARLTSMHGNKMLFKGIERDFSGAKFVQEWSVQIGN